MSANEQGVEIENLAFPALEYFLHSYIAVYDIKEGLELDQNEYVQSCPEAFFLCCGAIVRAEHKEDPSPVVDQKGYIEDIRDQYMYFGISSDYQNYTPEEIIELCRSRGFFPPTYLFRHGELIPNELL
ncbi:hypothetical protein [Halomonas colorata]|uniref:Uncharacterized protein n=1 Tax=Halomonas colorata TaxID=2742615 RepID=A0ABR9G1Y9_9GAMM|nr:hypothetical protein [Halomonas colorata]MBE0464870.1 hypothetical protein [Halomonas colorata]